MGAPTPTNRGLLKPANISSGSPSKPKVSYSESNRLFTLANTEIFLLNSYEALALTTT